jgi:hypothetical protein
LGKNGIIITGYEQIITNVPNDTDPIKPNLGNNELFVERWQKRTQEQIKEQRALEEAETEKIITLALIIAPVFCTIAVLHHMFKN